MQPPRRESGGDAHLSSCPSEPSSSSPSGNGQQQQQQQQQRGAAPVARPMSNGPNHQGLRFKPISEMVVRKPRRGHPAPKSGASIQPLAPAAPLNGASLEGAAVVSGRPILPAAGFQQQLGLSYETCWKASSSKPGGANAAVDATSFSVFRSRGSGSTRFAAASVALLKQRQAWLHQSARSLDLLDAAASAKAVATTLQLTTTGGSLSPASPSPLGAKSPDPLGAWAIARCLVLEDSVLKLSAFDVDSHDKASGVMGSAATWSFPDAAESSGSLYGSRSLAGVVFHSQIVHLPPSGAESVHSSQPHRGMKGSFVVTGGSGMAAGHVAVWLAQEVGADHVHLVSRSGMLPQALLSSGLHGAQQCQAVFTASKCDPSSDEDAEWLLRGLATADKSALRKPLSGLIHASGTLVDALLPSLTLGEMRQAFAPKGDSLARVMNRASLHPCCAHVLFSSVAALLGSPGQANYAAANSALDTAAAGLQVG